MKKANKQLIAVLQNSWMGNLTFPKITVTNVSTNARTVRFALSRLQGPEASYLSYRKLLRTDSPSWETTSVVVSQQKTFSRQWLSINRAEDPRLFVYGGKSWLYTQTFIEEKRDIEISIWELTSKKQFILKSPLGFNGKNWVPFTKDGELFFIYSLEPLIIMRAEFKSSGIELFITHKNSTEDFNPIWGHNPETSIGFVRGGSPGIVSTERQNIVTGFSHAINDNDDIHAHRFGIYEINLENSKLEHVYLTNYISELLVDPYGLTNYPEFMRVDASVALRDIHVVDSMVANVSFWFPKKEINELFRH